MKKIFKGFIMSVMMFSIIPMPSSAWDDESMPYCIPFFPLVGVIIGVTWYAVSMAIMANFTHSLLSSAFIMLYPFVLSGFIHTDGFIDTADAVYSRRDIEEKKRILKDPHMGAFAAIALCVLFLLNFSAVYDITSAGKPITAFIFLPFASRSISGFALLAFKPLSDKGFGAMFKNNTGKAHIIVLVFFICICIVLSYAAGGLFIFLPVVTASLAALLTIWYLYRQFKGVSGDICGAVVIVSELAGLICTALINF